MSQDRVRQVLYRRSRISRPQGLEVLHLWLRPPRKSCAVVDDDTDRSVGVRCRALSLACREEDDSKTHENQKQFPFLHHLFSFLKYMFTECDMNIARSMERQALHCILDGLDHQGKCLCPWFHRFLGYMSDTSQGAVTTRLVMD